MRKAIRIRVARGSMTSSHPFSIEPYQLPGNTGMVFQQQSQHLAIGVESPAARIKIPSLEIPPYKGVTHTSLSLIRRSERITIPAIPSGLFC